MNTLLTIITRLTEDASDNEYETIWLPIVNRHLDSKYVSQLGSANPSAICFTLGIGYLLIVSGTNAATRDDTSQVVTQIIVKRVEQAVGEFGLMTDEHVILYHNSHRYDPNLLAESFGRLARQYIGYNLGERYELPTSRLLYAPLYATVDQYLTNHAQVDLLRERFMAAVDYGRTGGQRQLAWPVLDFQPLFTEVEREEYIFIANPENFGPDNVLDNVLTSPEALQRFLRSSNAQAVFKPIIILCELNWVWDALDDKSYPFRGVEIIKQLRLQSSLETPVLFVSAAPETAVYRFDDTILFAVGHHFVSLHELPDPTLRKGKIMDGLRHPRLSRSKLSTLELLDIREHFCDVYGTKKLLHHQLKGFEGLLGNVDSSNTRRLTPFVSNWSQQFEDVCKEIGILPPNAIATAINLIALVKESIGKLEEQISSNAPKQSAEENYGYGRRAWNVVIVDDEATDERYKWLAEKLSTYGCKVTFYRTADEVFDHLNDEQKNRDTRVLIADYRLAESGGFPPKLQAQQGYDILAHVATRWELAIALVAFSGMPRKFLMRTFNQFGIKVDVFSKLDYFTNKQTINDFTDKIVKLGDECDDSLALMPKSEQWRKTLEPAYRAYRRALNRDDIETYVAGAATELIRTYKAGNSLSIPACDSDKINRIAELDNTTLKKFIRIFASRRFAAYVGLIETKPGIQKIVEFIRAKPITENAAGVFATTILAFNLSALPFGLTYEEIRFLKYQYGIDVQNFLYFLTPLQEELQVDVAANLKASGATLIGPKPKRKSKRNQ